MVHAEELQRLAALNAEGVKKTHECYAKDNQETHLLVLEQNFGALLL